MYILGTWYIYIIQFILLKQYIDCKPSLIGLIAKRLFKWGQYETFLEADKGFLKFAGVLIDVLDVSEVLFTKS